ncbi:MAG: hypothetical protein AW09_002243 [Candidatus Accumulibacter phosphatis]|uniref:Uncharacterized protein n=1 Tax=Candidatus Accumulibacter phosphatis TaxID=327160 RepID=A0A080LXM1_9PROT|nr:MAG: hypothetical protein AW09_002243 [Candidatus Accumulibacter phosphatis]
MLGRDCCSICGRLAQGSERGQEIAANGLQFLHRQRGSRQVAVMQRVLGVSERMVYGFADPDPAASMCRGTTRQLAQTTGGLMKRRIDPTAPIDEQARQAIIDAHRLQPGMLDQKRAGMDDHRIGENGRHSRHQRPGSELREGMLPAVGQDDVVSGLRAAVETDDRVYLPAPAEGVGKHALATIAETQTEQGDQAGHAHRPSPLV